MNYEKNIYIIETVNLFNAFVFFRGSDKNKMYNRNIVVFHPMYTKLLFFIQCIPNMH